MSSMACRFVGSLIATISDEPERETGMMRCFSHTSLRDELHDLGVDLVLVEVDRRARGTAARGSSVISPSEM